MKDISFAARICEGLALLPIWFAILHYLDGHLLIQCAMLFASSTLVGWIAGLIVRAIENRD
jgi:hypothetical protein